MNRTRSQVRSFAKTLGSSFEPRVPLQAFMVNDEAAVESVDAGGLDGHHDARQLVRLLQCPRCSRPLSSPVTLPCGHTVCRPCLPAPKPRSNISYPNTPDRLLGISCPLRGCGAEHASAECSVDVALAKVMELVAVEIAAHRPALEETPTLLEVTPGEHMSDDEKDSSSEKGHEELLYGGRLVSTYTLAEMGKLPYTSEVQYKTESPQQDSHQALDTAVMERLQHIMHEELDCLICYNLMLDPTTTSCGHSFCRRCLTRVMDYSSICPFCRRDINAPASTQHTAGNTVVNSLLNGLCPDLIMARSMATKIEEQAGDNVMNTPLFVCTLSLPTMPTFLHVFESRYRLMMRRVIEGTRRFGMVMYNRAQAPQGDLGDVGFLEYGTMLEVLNYEVLRDGRSFIETRGIYRFKIKDHGMLDGYHIGRVERVDDVSLAEESAAEQRETTMARDYAELFFREHPQQHLPADIAIEAMSTQQLLNACTSFIHEMRQASAPWLRDRIIRTHGEPPRDPALFPYWFASVVPIIEEEKYVLLHTTHVRARLKIVYLWIGRLRGQRWSTGNACNIL